MREGYVGVVAAALLLLCVLITPWLFGAVQFWAQLIALLLIALAVPVSLIHGLIERKSVGVTASVVALLVVVGIGILQLLSWSPDALAVISPKAQELRVAFGDAADKFHALSMYPAATRSVVILLAMAALVIVVANRSVSSVMQRPILLAVAANGAVLSLLAGWQRLWGDNLVYGVVQAESRFPIGPFVNRNNAAGYLLMCLAAGIATLLLTLASMQSSAQAERIRAKHRRPDYQMLVRNPVGILAIVFCGMIVLGILLTQSRGGCMALALGGCAAVFIGAKRNHLGVLAITIALTTIVPIIVLVIAEQWLPASNRLSTLGDQTVMAEESRISLWAGAMDLAGDFLWSGCGLGTFRYVFPLYDRAPGGAVFGHAENQFIEILCEAGLVAAIAVGIACFLFGFRLIDQLGGGTPRNRALAAAGVFFFVSQAVANCFDFGLAIPANLLLCCFMIGTFESSFRRKSLKPDKPNSPTPENVAVSPVWNHVVAFLYGKRSEMVMLGLLLLACFGAVDLMRASSVESVPVATLVQAYPEPLIEERIQVQLDRVGRNIHYRWDDAEAHYVIAESLIRLFEAKNLNFENASAESKISKLSDLAEAVQLTRDAEALSQSGAPLFPAGLREELEPIRKHLLLSRDACCLNPKVHLRLAHISFVSSVDSEREHFARATRIVEGNRHNLYLQGKHLYDQEQMDAAYAVWKNCLHQGSRYEGAIVAAASANAPIDKLSDSLFPDDKEFYEALLNEHFAAAEHSQKREQVLALMSRKFGTTN